MKYIHIKNTFRIIIATILIGYTMLLGLLNSGPTEQALTHFVAKQLSNKIGSEVSIGNIEIGLFNRLMLEDVCIKDLQKQTMLKAQTITAKVELKSLFKSQLTLRTISLLDEVRT